MEQNNKFFVYDSYVFAFKNALANARIITLAYITWLAVLIPLAIITGLSYRTCFAMLPSIGVTWKPLAHQLLQTSSVMMLLLILITLLVAAWITISLVQIVLRIYKTGEAYFSDLFPSPWLIIKAYISFIILIPIALLGLILFIVPGLYFIIRSWFYMYALVEGEGIFEAFSTSFRITHGKEWQIFSLLVIGGALATVTMFFGIFIWALSSIYVYRLLKKGS